MIRTADDDINLRRRNSIEKYRRRRIEKNRFPVKCSCVICGGSFLCRGIEEYLQRQHYLGPDKRGDIRHVCWGCGLENKVKVAAGTLYQLINAIPQAERDCAEIYPEDFRFLRIPLWRQEKMRLPGLGLRDYAGPARLLSKFGTHELVARQKAASPVRDVPAITSWRRPTLPETQPTLKRIGRLYKNSCWWSKKGPRRLFDKAQALSWGAQSWAQDSARVKFDPADAVLLEKRERQEKRPIARMGGEVQHLGHPAKRHASLAKTRAAYNEQWDSYTNNNRLGRTLREQRSLNIPRETIEARNTMIENLERDFAPRNEREAA